MIKARFLTFLIIASFFSLPILRADNAFQLASIQKFSLREHCSRGSETVFFDLGGSAETIAKLIGPTIEQLPQRDFIFLNAIQHQKFSLVGASVQMFQSQQMDANLMRYSMYRPLKGQGGYSSTWKDNGSTAFAIYHLAKDMQHFLR